MSQPAAQPHPLIQKLSEVYNVSRLANIGADGHERCRAMAEEVAAFIADATKPAVQAEPIPGPGSKG